ncbi:MAG TPA: hypothetical protein DCX54_04305 [Flavobacteriales bacterium]|nr:hypothetical protein [Flavobacteriales bacterium]
MKFKGFCFLLTLILTSVCMKSQTPISQWKNYSLTQKGIYHHSQVMNNPDPLCEVSLIIIKISFSEIANFASFVDRIPTMVNSDQTIVGRRSFFPLFTAWDIYTDYPSQESFDYMDLDY